MTSGLAEKFHSALLHPPHPMFTYVSFMNDFIDNRPGSLVAFAHVSEAGLISFSGFMVDLSN